MLHRYWAYGFWSMLLSKLVGRLFALNLLLMSLGQNTIGATKCSCTRLRRRNYRSALLNTIMSESGENVRLPPPPPTPHPHPHSHPPSSSCLQTKYINWALSNKVFEVTFWIRRLRSRIEYIFCSRIYSLTQIKFVCWTWANVHRAPICLLHRSIKYKSTQEALTYLIPYNILLCPQSASYWCDAPVVSQHG